MKINEIGWHVLRHTAATLMTDAGVSINKVSAFLGHADLSQTTIYVRSKDCDLDAAADAIP